MCWPCRGLGGHLGVENEALRGDPLGQQGPAQVFQAVDRLFDLRVGEKVPQKVYRVLAEMETEGFLIDRGALAEFGNMLAGRIDEVQKTIYALAGSRPVAVTVFWKEV